MSGKQISGKVHASGNVRRGKLTRRENECQEGFTHRDKCVPRTVSFSATIIFIYLTLLH